METYVTKTEIQAPQQISPRKHFKSSKSNIRINNLFDFEKDNNDLDKLDNLDFNIFEFEKKVGRENVLSMVFTEVIEQLVSAKGEWITIKREKLKNFIKEIHNGYLDNNPYHNSLHAADVTQTLLAWCTKTDLAKIFEFSKYELLAIYTSGIAHDFKHPGLNNNYIMNSTSQIAITYNDKSVLENYHVSETFKVLLNPDNNIFEYLSVEDFKILRKRIIEAILATDMSFHFQSFSLLKAKLDHLEVYEGKNTDKIINNSKNATIFSEQQEIINFLFHTADISHNTKDWEISKIWSKNIYEEFFNQGDLEKKQGLPISMLCDRETTNIAKSQQGFIAGIISPTFTLLVRFLPPLHSLITNIEKNTEKWERLENKRKETLKELKSLKELKDFLKK